MDDLGHWAGHRGARRVRRSLSHLPRCSVSSRGDQTGSEQHDPVGRTAVLRGMQGVVGTQRREEFIRPGSRQGRLRGSGQWLLNCPSERKERGRDRQRGNTATADVWTGSRAARAQILAMPFSRSADIGTFLSSLCHGIPVFKMELMRIEILISRGSCEG